MKYFAPRRIAAYGSAPAAWRDAEARWDSACERYHAYLATIEADLPEGLRRLHNDYRLHDAVVRAAWRRAGRFLIVHQLDSPPVGLLTVTYDLTDAPAIPAESLTAELRSSGELVDWQ